MNLAEYGKAHRTREHGTEDGSVKEVGTTKKKWEGVYHAYVAQPDGTHKRITRRRIIGLVSKMTKTQARDEHREWVRRFHERPVADTTKATVAQIADDYYTMRSGDWDLVTQKTISSVFTSLIKPGIGSMPLESVTPEDLKKFINSLPSRHTVLKTVVIKADGTRKEVPSKTQRKGVSYSYVKKCITMLRAIFDLAVERDLVRKNPARSITVKLTVPKATKAVAKPLFPPAYLPALLAQLKARDSLVVWLSILGATRPNELFAVRGADVGPDFVHIHRALNFKRELKGTKTGPPRYVQLPPQIAMELRDWIRLNEIGPDDIVFANRDGGHIYRNNYLKRVIHAAAERAGITSVKVDFRMLRRSFSTIANALGFDVKSVQAQMGHSKPDMTASEYMQPVDALRREQMKRLEDVLRGRVPMPHDITAKLGSPMVQ